jgi:putrescine importer
MFLPNQHFTSALKFVDESQPAMFYPSLKNMTSENSPPPSASADGASPPRLRRVLGMKDLILYGIVLIQPVGAVGVFGIADQKSFGHVTTTILFALVAMMLTAISYGRMAGLYPAAGSAYTYVGRGLNPHLGFLAGWAMFLDYLVIPIISVVYGAISIYKFIDDFSPGWSANIATSLGLHLAPERQACFIWIIVLTVLTTFLNLRGIKWTAGANIVLTIAMFVVIGIFAVQAIQYLSSHAGWGSLVSTKPVYNPSTFNFRAICGATSLAALTYIGFDGITTLSEDVKEPKRTVPPAIVLVCVIIGLCVALQTYLGQLVWPDYTTFKDPDAAFFDVCRLVGGRFLFDAFTLIMAVACLGSAITGQVGAARILFGMGRDNALPKVFARLDKHNSPALNIAVIGVLALAGALLLDYEKAANLVNFGAFLAFIGVNAAVIREFFFRPPPGHKRNLLFDVILPGLAFIFCFWLWLQLPTAAKIVGGIWCAIGIIYTAFNTRGFTRQPKMIDLSGS